MKMHATATTRTTFFFFPLRRRFILACERLIFGARPSLAPVVAPRMNSPRERCTIPDAPVMTLPHE